MNRGKPFGKTGIASEDNAVISAIAQIPASIGRAPIRFGPLGADRAERKQADAESDTGLDRPKHKGLPIKTLCFAGFVSKGT